MSNYLKNVNNHLEMELEIVAIFGTWDGFKVMIGRVFGDINAERTAIRHIRALKQKGPASVYIAEF
jgi:hypothetical protein